MIHFIMVFLLIFYPLYARALDRDTFGMPLGFNPNGDKELIISRAGKVWLEDSGQHNDNTNLGSTLIKLNNKIIGKFSGYLFGSIEKRIEAKDFDLLLFTIDMGGSGTLPELRAVSIKPSGEYHLFDELLTEQFNDATLAHNLAYRVVDNKIYLDLGFEEKLNKNIEIDFNYIKITKQQPDIHETIQQSLCQNLFKGMQNECIFTKSNFDKQNCKEIEGALGMNLARQTYYYDDFPKFSSRAAFEICKDLCNKGRKIVTLKSFMAKACGIK